MFQFGGAWSFVWGAKPPKAPRGDGTETESELGDFQGTMAIPKFCLSSMCPQNYRLATGKFSLYFIL